MIFKNISLRLFHVLIVVFCISFAYNSMADDLETDNAFWTTIDSEEKYFAVLDSIEEDVFKREYEQPFLVLLNDEQKKTYQSLDSFNMRKGFVRVYWNAYNPNPLLSENDWLMAFLKRIVHVKEHFSILVPPYFDDRGKYYLKYGEPDERITDNGGMVPIDVHVYNQILEKIYSFPNIPPNRHYNVRPNESWSYQRLSLYFTVHFVDKGDYFEETPNLFSDVIRFSDFNKYVLWYWTDFIKKRARVSPSLMETAMAIQDFENELLRSVEEIESNQQQLITRLATLLELDDINPRGFERASLDAIQQAYATDKVFDNLHQKILEMRHEQRIKESIGSSQQIPAAYDPVLAVNTLAITEHVLQFKGPGKSTRLELLIESPIENNIITRDLSKSEGVLDLDYSCLVRDEVFNPQEHMQKEMQLPVDLLEREKIDQVSGHLSVLSFPGTNELTVQLKNKQDGAIGYIKHAIDVRDYNRSDLMMSDIQLFTTVKNQNYQKLQPVIEKNGTLLTPLSNIVKKDAPLFCYFEIYNLIFSGLIDEFELTYRITHDESKDGILKRVVSGSTKHTISSTQVYPITDNSLKELLSIDFSSLNAGTYILELAVTAPGDDYILASATKEIKFVQ